MVGGRDVAKGKRLPDCFEFANPPNCVHRPRRCLPNRNRLGGGFAFTIVVGEVSDTVLGLFGRLVGETGGVRARVVEVPGVNLTDVGQSCVLDGEFGSG